LSVISLFPLNEIAGRARRGRYAGGQSRNGIRWRIAPAHRAAGRIAVAKRGFRLESDWWES
jgi:hypothetical protein